MSSHPEASDPATSMSTTRDSACWTASRVLMATRREAHDLTPARAV
eukprot:CAMPEP_0185314224 /NCGR_PEP_ID=MMETSP1363-20130426/38215_1 /TAXON_ID=38817 /ORGANISM="Gephyrocapsa oceanica, Strain RCC1303" /LENGTH=45 /DNA_ID= /DNA_START= /DNA_END= /DNA_ORIENTATION=